MVSKYYSRLALRAHLKPWKFDILPREPKPKAKDMKYYTDPEKRGYLSQQVQLQELKKAIDEDGTHSVMARIDDRS